MNAKIKTVFDLIPFWGLSTQEIYQLCGTYHINYTDIETMEKLLRCMKHGDLDKLNSLLLLDTNDNIDINKYLDVLYK